MAKVYHNISTKRLRVYKGGETSSAPWVKNNPYQSLYGSADGTILYASDAVLHTVPIPDHAINRAIAKFNDAINGDRAELLTAAVEWRSSLDMVTKRATQLARAYTALKRFDLPRVFHELSIPSSVRKSTERSWSRQRVVENPTALWLEYWMGWAPAYSDIYNALDAIGRPYPNQHISVGVNAQSPNHERHQRAGDWFRESAVCSYSTQYALYGEVQITNHNLYLASQLGLTNPALTAWNVVPASFIADWVLNVGQVLDSLVPFAGVTLTNTGRSYFCRASRHVSGSVRKWENGQYVLDTYNGWAELETRVRAPASIPTPRLTARFNALSLTRAATAVSLLSEIFLSKK